MPATYLDAISKYHRQRAQQDRRDWRSRAEIIRYEGPRLTDALARHDGQHVKVIAEIKRRSPSKGWLAEHVDAAQLAQQYAAGGACAVSVLTDVAHFAGCREDLESVAHCITLPLLRKDFTVSENDVLDTAQMGASGVLLIAAILQPAELLHLVTLAVELGLSPLVEVHDAREAQVALDSGATLIGVNQRDLHTFEVDADHAARVIANLPQHVIRVAESGLRSPADVRRAGEAGFDAVLVGEVFVTSKDPRETVSDFAHVDVSLHRG